MASDDAAVQRLSKRLADEAMLDRTSLDQVKNSPERTRKLKALCGLYVTLGQVGIMKHRQLGWHRGGQERIALDRRGVCIRTRAHGAKDRGVNQ